MTDSPTKQIIAYYEERARGGVGLIITEVCAMAYPRGANSVHQLGLSDDRYIPALRRLTDQVHRHGAKIAVQLVHHGKVSRVDIKEGRPVLVPSIPQWHGSLDMINDLTPEELGLMAAANGGGKPNYHEMTAADIVAVTAEFAAAARRAQQAGFDGVEIHGCPRLSDLWIPLQAVEPPRPMSTAEMFTIDHGCCVRLLPLPKLLPTTILRFGVVSTLWNIAHRTALSSQTPK